MFVYCKCPIIPDPPVEGIVWCTANVDGWYCIGWHICIGVIYSGAGTTPHDFGPVTNAFRWPAINLVCHNNAVCESADLCAAKGMGIAGERG